MEDTTIAKNKLVPKITQYLLKFFLWKLEIFGLRFSEHTDRYLKFMFLATTINSLYNLSMEIRIFSGQFLLLKLVNQNTTWKYLVFK